LVDLDANQDILLIRKHLVEHLGPPDEVFEVSGSPIPGSPVQALNLAYFAPAGPHSPVVFATCGASQFTMKDGRRVEGILILRKEPDADAFDAVHRMLASFALFAEANNQVIRQGDVVRAPEELSKFCDMDAILFMPPIPFVPSFHKVHVTDGEVEVLWLVPVFEQEAEYALANGPQSLMMLFAAQGLDLTEPRRGEANTLMEPKDAAEMAKRMGEESARKAESEGPRPILTQPTKPKTSRRDVGKGSYDVEEHAGEVKISRRSKGKKPAPPPTGRPQHPPPQRDRQPSSALPPQQRRKPITPAIPKVKEETRFDLGKRPEPPPPPKIPVRREKKEEPKEDPEQAKQRRIAELKQKAKEAAERAKARKEGRTGEGPMGPIEGSQPSISSAQRAAQRRGAPKRAITDQLDEDD
jgi:hypothetical protein